MQVRRGGRSEGGRVRRRRYGWDGPVASPESLEGSVHDNVWICPSFLDRELSLFKRLLSNSVSEWVGAQSERGRVERNPSHALSQPVFSVSLLLMSLLCCARALSVVPLLAPLALASVFLLSPIRQEKGSRLSN